MLQGALLGFGNMGEAVAKRMAEFKDARIATVFDPGAERRAVAESLGLKAVAKLDDAFASRIDFALVVSPNRFHCEQVLAAVQAGAHVYCEKPLALNLDECDRMVAAVEAARRVNVVTFSIRYSGAGRVMKRLVDDGALGELLTFWRIRSRGYGLFTAGARHPAVVDPAASGGWTMHHMCHDIDALYWLCGAYKKVWSLSRSTVPGGASEELIWTLAELERAGQTVRPTAMIGDAVHRMHFEEEGASGSAGTMRRVLRDGREMILLQPEGGEPGLRSGAGRALPEREFPTADAAEPGGGLGHFFDCLVSGKASQVTFRDARAAVAVARACQQSARAGGQPIDL